MDRVAMPTCLTGEWPMRNFHPETWRGRQLALLDNGQWPIFMLKPLDKLSRYKRGNPNVVDEEKKKQRTTILTRQLIKMPSPPSLHTSNRSFAAAATTTAA
ncbi:hypothetical protein DITRI_Ditri04bG0094700 [Diplodiscus trichospermus]